MNTKSRKRFEEAAKEYSRRQGFGSLNQHEMWLYKAGVECGYEVAIEQAKKWIGDICEKVGFSNKTVSQCVESFETDMNKLLERG